MTPAQVNAPGCTGWAPLHHAAIEGNARVCGLLIQAGARLDVTDEVGANPLVFVQDEHPENALLLALLSGTWTGPLPGTVCERCSAVPDSALMHCSGCLSVAYCCPRCATADWPSHAAYCKERREKREADLRGCSSNG